MPRIFKAVFIQLLALLLLALSVWLLSDVLSPPYSYPVLVLAQSLVALGVTIGWRMERWWWLIQFALPWLLFLAMQVGFNPLLALAIFIGVLLIFANAFTDRVPLYLTNSKTRLALQALLKEQFAQGRVRFLDLGSGLGANVRFMAQQPAVEVSHGVETALIPFLFSRLLCSIKGPSCQAAFFAKDLWNYDLQGYDFVYAFLSTEPMPRLWRKVCAEMPAGSWFVSNSFAVPDVEPTAIWQLDDRRQTLLYLYQIH